MKKEKVEIGGYMIHMQDREIPPKGQLVDIYDPEYRGGLYNIPVAVLVQIVEAYKERIGEIR